MLRHAALVGIALFAFAASAAAQTPAGAAKAPSSGTVYRTPLAGEVVVTQGPDGGDSHNDAANRHAIDFAGPIGRPVLAARDGIVIAAVQRSHIGGRSDAYAADANSVAVRHDDETVAIYHHLALDPRTAREGERVVAGEIIGFVGATGIASGPHLHFAVMRDGVSIPVMFADFESAKRAPRTGDCYESRNVCAWPQDRIDRIKRTHRAAAAAESAGDGDIACLIRFEAAGDFASDHPYARILCAAAAEGRRALANADGKSAEGDELPALLERRRIRVRTSVGRTGAAEDPPKAAIDRFTDLWIAERRAFLAEDLDGAIDALTRMAEAFTRNGARGIIETEYARIVTRMADEVMRAVARYREELSRVPPESKEPVIRPVRALRDLCRRRMKALRALEIYATKAPEVLAGVEAQLAGLIY